MKSTEIANGSYKARKDIFHGCWRKDDLYFIIVESLVKLLPGITWKIKNILNKPVHLAKISILPSANWCSIAVCNTEPIIRKLRYKNCSIFKRNLEEIKRSQEGLLSLGGKKGIIFSAPLDGKRVTETEMSM